MGLYTEMNVLILQMALFHNWCSLSPSLSGIALGYGLDD
jgi:hypothetical protein